MLEAPLFKILETYAFGLLLLKEITDLAPQVSLTGQNHIFIPQKLSGNILNKTSNIFQNLLTAEPGEVFKLASDSSASGSSLAILGFRALRLLARNLFLLLRRRAEIGAVILDVQFST